ncbi:MAG: hypothetical protein ACPGSC_04970, partial [Granulosicoccaceae bacterium]
QRGRQRYTDYLLAVELCAAALVSPVFRTSPVIISRNSLVLLLLATVALYGVALGAGYWLGRGPGVAPVISFTVINKSGVTIDRVVVRHGGKNLQEEIVLLQLREGERREIGVNQEIGAGFNVEVFRSGRETMSVCAGKGARTAWHQLTVLPNNLRFSHGIKGF